MENRDIIVTEYIGRSGLDKQISLNEDRIRKHFSRAFIRRPEGRKLRDPDRRSPEEKAAAIIGTLKDFGVPGNNGKFCTEISDGGVLAALWDMCAELGCGMEVDLLKLPLRQETIEICEYLEINPYELESGSEVRLIAVEGGTALIDKLSQQGIDAVVVGHVISGKQKLLKINDRIRYLDRPACRKQTSV